MDKKKVIIKVMGGCIVTDVWTDGDVEEVIIFDPDEREIGRRAVVKGIPEPLLDKIDVG